jgi:hypothetical protein
MNRRLPLVASASIALLLAAAGAGAQSDPVPDWPDHYDPFTLLTYNLTMTKADWDTIRRDLTYDIEVPCLLQANGEAPVLVSVRRKSASAFPDESDPQKVALKIDINEYADEDAGGNVVCVEDHGFSNPTCVEKWHGMKKLSLESGDDMNVITEGVAWYLHRLASEEVDYTPGLAAWIELHITLTNGNDADGQPIADSTFYNGVFVNVEQHDKQFLKNHGLWQGGDDTWLLKYGDPYDPEVKEAPEDAQGQPLESPAARSLNFRPFQDCSRRRGSTSCDPQPSGAAFVSALDHYINMEGLLALGAVSAFHGSPDDLVSKGKNFFLVDYSDVSLGRREYLQWDLDSAFAGFDATADIYDQGRGKFGDYEDWIIDEPAFNERYAQTMQTLLDGPLDAADLEADLTAFESILTNALDADPHNALSEGTAAEFASLRAWIANRITHVRAQLPGGPPPPPGASVHLADLSGASAPGSRNRWDATARIDIHDAGHVPADGATVTGAWSTGGEGSCVTVSGSCEITRTRIRNRLDTTTFTVLDVALPGASYDSGADHVLPSIVIGRP